MDIIKEHIYSIVCDIVNRKRGKIAPMEALYMKEILPQTVGYNPHDVSAALQELCREKRLRWSPTINDKCFAPL